MENTSSNELAQQILDCCLSGRPWSEPALHKLLERATVDSAGRSQPGTLHGNRGTSGRSVRAPALRCLCPPFQRCHRVRPARAEGPEDLIRRYNRIRQPRRAPDRRPKHFRAFACNARSRRGSNQCGAVGSETALSESKNPLRGPAQKLGAVRRRPANSALRFLLRKKRNVAPSGSPRSRISRTAS